MLRLRRGLQRVREAPRSVAAGVDDGLAFVQQEPDTVIRDFDDPYLELVRLLHEAAEIEHALLVQYLYAALSVTDQYKLVRGNPERPNAENLVGVAVWEMQHLATVNKLLVTLGASPGLTSQDFPTNQISTRSPSISNR
jgi:Ferritin-like